MTEVLYINKKNSHSYLPSDNNRKKPDVEGNQKHIAPRLHIASRARKAVQHRLIKTVIHRIRVGARYMAKKHTH